jgi:phage tail sheath gpL-like
VGKVDGRQSGCEEWWYYGGAWAGAVAPAVVRQDVATVVIGEWKETVPSPQVTLSVAAVDGSAVERDDDPARPWRALTTC